MAEKERDVLTITLLVLSAGLVGATIGLLFAPQSGKRTRRDLRRMGTRFANRADEFQRDLRDRVNDLIEDALASGQEGLERGREATEQLRKELLHTLESGREVLSEQLDRVEALFSGK